MNWSHLLSVLETSHETTMAQLATNSLFSPMSTAVKSPAEPLIRGLNLASPSFYTGRLHIRPVLSEIYKTVSKNPDNTLTVLQVHSPFQHLFLEFYTGVHPPEKLIICRRRFGIQFIESFYISSRHRVSDLKSIMIL